MYTSVLPGDPSPDVRSILMICLPAPPTGTCPIFTVCPSAKDTRIDPSSLIVTLTTEFISSILSSLSPNVLNVPRAPVTSSTSPSTFVRSSCNSASSLSRISSFCTRIDSADLRSDSAVPLDISASTLADSLESLACSAVIRSCSLRKIASILSSYGQINVFSL